MRTIYEIGPLGHYTGESREIGDDAGWPPGWTPTAPPDLADGQAAAWIGGAWTIVAAPRPVDAGAMAAQVAAQALEDAREAKYQAEAAALAAIYAAGFPCVTAGLAGRRLQVRPGTSDQANWLTFYTDCQEAITAGQGAATCPIPIRTMENVNVDVSFNDGLTEMRAMRAWGAAVMAADWAVNDSIAAAADADALAAIALVSAP